MANGYGSSPSSSRKSNVDDQGKKAPAGFHYMPDGSLMSDKEHEKLHKSKPKMGTEAVELTQQVRPTILGCTDPTASNYNPLATIDDGSCAIFGCMDINSPNYNPLATVDDGTCFPCDCTYNGGFWCETHNHLPVAGYSPLPPVWTGTLNTLANFIDAMWNGFTNNGCQYLESRILHWTSQLPNITNANHLAQKQGKINWATAVLDNCDCNPPDFCYEIGDVGPGGGIVFSTPMTGNNSTSYYYEMHIEDLAYCSNNWSEIIHLNPIIQPPDPMDARCEEGIFDWSLLGVQQIPFAEWGGYNYNVGQLDVFPQYVGIGLANTTAQIASPSIQAVVFPSNETASSLCDNLTAFNPPSPTGFSDWYLPSAGEWELINQNIGPSTTFAAISNLEVSPSTGFGYPGVGQILDKYPRYYWTSSALTNPLPTAPDTNHLQAYAYSISTSNTVPQGVVVADRCSALGVKAIRRFKCPPVRPPDPRFYNYRDVYMGRQMDRMPSITTPGMCNSGNMIPGDNLNAWKNDVIGLYNFTIGLATTDVLGNTYTYQQLMSSANPSGYTITIWDNNKNYLGKWHYAELALDPPQLQPPNILSMAGMKRVVDQGGGVVNVLGDNFAPNGNNNSNVTPELPRFINLRLRNVTHLDGPNPLVRYGTTNPLTEAIAISNGCALNNFNIDTETGCVGHQTSSYCFVKFECDATSGNQFENLDTGPNTDPQGSHVMCTGKWINLWINGGAPGVLNPLAGTNLTPAMMNLYNETQASGAGYGPHVRHLSGRLGVGQGPYSNYSSGSWLASPGQSYTDNPVYGTPNNWNEPQLQNLQLGQTWPLHYLHPWFASAPPSSVLTNNGITWYPDMQTAINTTAADQNGPCYTGNDSINIINA